jgi:SAM-dependent methyltransferase
MYSFSMNTLKHNQVAWDRLSRAGNEWTVPVGADKIARAREGEWEVILTPCRPVPRAWFGLGEGACSLPGSLKGTRILCLASGGGQQAPVFAAAGAEVVSFDLSGEQLGKDQWVAERDGLALECIKGDMADLSVFDDSAFDLIFNPVSTVFVPDVLPVWKECFRVLKPGGALLTGFMNPGFFLFDHDPLGEGEELVVRYSLPTADTDPACVSPARRKEIEKGAPLEFSHSLDTLIGGQLEAGFILTGFYEDWWKDVETPLNRYSPTTMATRAVRP